MKKTLSQTNVYLYDKEKRQEALITSVCSSSAIEGIDAYTIIRDYLKHNKRRRLPDKPILSD
jgi:hypothetical protein